MAPKLKVTCDFFCGHKIRKKNLPVMSKKWYFFRVFFLAFLEYLNFNSTTEGTLVFYDSLDKLLRKNFLWQSISN